MNRENRKSTTHHVVYTAIALALALPADAGYMVVKSPAFISEGRIPDRYTCYGLNQTLPLHWFQYPDGTESLVLIMRDLDAPWGEGQSGNHLFYHWLVWNIPPTLERIPPIRPEGDASMVGDEPFDQGTNDFFKFGKDAYGYGGPCPPHGVHRYEIKLYALDERRLTGLRRGSNSTEVIDAIRIAQEHGHVLEVAVMIGRVPAADPKRYARTNGHGQPTFI
ncbi:unnamed protein product [Vitrella brassicaformis CCMP3155]|uniref:YbhB/YbcL family Raf kinase inhibitor-like protein n=1 Tax=Vitrella brassicaformis (strain CCMP3155) TaxID=1169540 RepID=A0A0G4ELS1_VITBC|nr:unnamed protein product [Vitrella brassicaformis CCMP3155]|eukprot:CEL97778.1 unnamed protein product [Vitrella brassicaformis CCMP3155]